MEVEKFCFGGCFVEVYGSDKNKCYFEDKVLEKVNKKL